MDGEADTKECSNCKRDIPAQNFIVHSLHCQRNIKLCPVCKEPVSVEELQQHHDRMHSLAPCKLCGESVCGTDLEDHIRDSCAHTMHTCRFCELEVRRGSIPQHEGYCGARTERCEECGAFVMAKYRQLHLQSNHGFIKLDDEPDPTPPPTPRLSPRPYLPLNSQLGTTTPIDGARTKLTIERGKRRDDGFWANEDFGFRSGNGLSVNAMRPAIEGSSRSDPTIQRTAAGNSGVKKRSNDQPQANSTTDAGNIVDLTGNQGGAIRKQRPPRGPHKEPRRETVYQRAVQRRSSEERQLQEQEAYSLSVGLPHVLSAAEKLDNLIRTPEHYKNCPLGSNRKMQAGKQTNINNNQANKHDNNNNNNGESLQVILDSSGEIDDSDLEMSYFKNDVIVISSEDELTPEDIPKNVNNSNQATNSGQNPAASPTQNLASNSSQNPASNSSQNPDINNQTQPVQLRYDFKNLRAMSEEEFQLRLQDIQLREQRRLKDDRFNAIKTSLRELRRDLNEVTAPYNASNNSQNSTQNQIQETEVRLPCEFCSTLVPASELVRHQTGCRPDLAQLSDEPTDVQIDAQIDGGFDGVIEQVDDGGEGPSAVIPCEFCSTLVPASELVLHETGCRPDLARLTNNEPTDVQIEVQIDEIIEQVDEDGEGPSPVIPCEFCSACLPVYLISEHQEMCQRERELT